MVMEFSVGFGLLGKHKSRQIYKTGLHANVTLCIYLIGKKN